MEVEMSDPNTVQENDAPGETRIPQSTEVTKSEKASQILATIAGMQIPS
jgi:hypothetical protein